MTLPDLLAAIVSACEAVPVAGGPGYRLARTAEDVGGAWADRMLLLQVQRRLGPLDTGLSPRVRYDASLVLQLQPGRADPLADQARLVDESAALARALERSGLPVLVGETTYQIGELEDAELVLASVLSLTLAPTET